MVRDAVCMTCGQRFVLTDDDTVTTPVHYLPERIPGPGRPRTRQSDQQCDGSGSLLAVKITPGT